MAIVRERGRGGAEEGGLAGSFGIRKDGGWGRVRQGQRLAGAERIAFELPTVNYAMMAEAMGVPGHVIESPEDFNKLDMAQILNRNGPTLLDIRIDGEEVPPMNLRVQTLEGSV